MCPVGFFDMVIGLLKQKPGMVPGSVKYETTPAGNA
jgi:hypothetical protein